MSARSKDLVMEAYNTSVYCTGCGKKLGDNFGGFDDISFGPGDDADIPYCEDCVPKKISERLKELQYKLDNIDPMPPIPLEATTPMLTFGKYKGKSVEEANPSYLMWLSEQDWLEEKYPEIYKYIKKNLEDLEEALSEDEWMMTSDDFLND